MRAFPLTKSTHRNGVPAFAGTTKRNWVPSFAGTTSEEWVPAFAGTTNIERADDNTARGGDKVIKWEGRAKVIDSTKAGQNKKKKKAKEERRRGRCKTGRSGRFRERRWPFTKRAPRRNAGARRSRRRWSSWAPSEGACSTCAAI